MLPTFDENVCEVQIQLKVALLWFFKLQTCKAFEFQVTLPSNPILDVSESFKNAHCSNLLNRHHHTSIFSAADGSRIAIAKAET